MKLSNLTIDPEAIERGIWIDNIPECGDLRIKTRGLQNSAWRALFNKLVQAVPVRDRRSGLSTDDSERITTQCLVETCLLDWENLVDEAGAPVPVTEAGKYLADPKFAPLRNGVFLAASMVADQYAADRADAEKNSSAA